MKIVYLSHARIPSRTANSLNVMKMCEAFARNGHRVVLLVPECVAPEPGVDDPFRFYGVERRFKLRRLPFKRDRFWGRFCYVTLVSWLVRLHRPDLIFARDHSLYFDLHAMRLPVVLEAHKFVDVKNTLRLEALLASDNFRRLVTNCVALGQEYASRFDIPPARICVAHNGADESGEDEAPRLGPADRLQVGYVGHLYAGKGMETIAEMADGCGWADCHIVGGTENDLTRWRSELHDRPNVVFHGYRPHAETDRYRRAMDILLAPCCSEMASDGGGVQDVRWMSPIKLFEYMAAGKAILAADLPVIREVLEDGMDALLCQPGETAGWIAALTRLRDHPELRERLGREARVSFLAGHTWCARAEHVLEGLPRR